MTDLLKPDWPQPKPTLAEVQEMCLRLPLKLVTLPHEPFDKLLADLRASHDHGGAHLVAFDIGADSVFDWYASRNRLWEAELLDNLLARLEIRTALADLRISALPQNSGLAMHDQFLFDGYLSNTLYFGGAYWSTNGDGKVEKLFAITVCDAMFGLRFGEINLCISSEPWTTWFKGIAWDFTAAVFDRRLRRLWILAVTDTD